MHEDPLVLKNVLVFPVHLFLQMSVINFLLHAQALDVLVSLCKRFQYLLSVNSIINFNLLNIILKFFDLLFVGILVFLEPVLLTFNQLYIPL